jgi:hypothetical protein
MPRALVAEVAQVIAKARHTFFKYCMLNRIRWSWPDVRRGCSGPGFTPGFFVLPGAGSLVRHHAVRHALDSSRDCSNDSGLTTVDAVHCPKARVEDSWRLVRKPRNDTWPSRKRISPDNGDGGLTALAAH